MAIKSIFERFADEFDRSSKREVDFATAYSNAATQRANAQRMFEDSLRQEDVNKRMWAQEGRASDLYQTYQKPMNAYGLSGAGMTDELGQASQAGNLAGANLASSVKTQLNTPEMAAMIAETQRNMAGNSAILSRGLGSLSPKDQLLVSQSPFLSQLLSGTLTSEQLTTDAALQRKNQAKFVSDYSSQMMKNIVGAGNSQGSIDSLQQYSANTNQEIPRQVASTTPQGMVGYTPRRQPVTNSSASSMPSSEQLSAQTNIWQQQLAQLIDNANNLKKANQLTPELADATRQKVDSLRGLIAQNQNLIQIAKASEAQNALRSMIGSNQ